MIWLQGKMLFTFEYYLVSKVSHLLLARNGLITCN